MDSRVLIAKNPRNLRCTAGGLTSVVLFRDYVSRGLSLSSLDAALLCLSAGVSARSAVRVGLMCQRQTSKCCFNAPVLCVHLFLEHLVEQLVTKQR